MSQPAQNTRPVVVAVDVNTNPEGLCRAALPLLLQLGAPIMLHYQADVGASLQPGTRLFPKAKPDGVEAQAYLDGAAAARLEELCAHVREEGLEVHPQIGHGPVVEGIVEAARSRDALMLVVGSDLMSGLWRLLGQGFTERILQQASCPVLVVSARGQAQQLDACEQIASEADG